MDCGECTLCCKLLELHEIPSKIGEYCNQCVLTVGCNIHNNKPKECQEYQCMWLQMENVGNELRPDKCGIIFDRICDDVITARIEKEKKLNSLLIGQINYFKKEGFSVLVFRGAKRKMFLNDSHTEEYVMGIVSDYSKLH